MGVGLAATVYVWIAHGLAFLLMPWSIPLSLRVRAVAFWAISAPILFMLQSPLAALLVVAVMLFFVAPFAALERTAFFLIAVPAVPVFVFAPLPFPGINYLIEVSHVKLAAAVLLLPLLLLVRNRSGRPGAFGVAEICLVLYILYVAAVFGLANNATVGLRVLVEQALMLAVPYFAMRLMLGRVDDIDVVFRAFLVASILLAVVALVSYAKKWDIYGILNPAPFTEFRGGWPRIDATANTHSLAYHLAAAVIVLEFLKRRMAIGWLWLNALRLVFVAGMMTTYSRGALAGLAVAWFVYILFMLKSGALRAVAIFAAALGALAVGVWLTQSDLSALDPHGTFAYRQELLRTSLRYILAHPLFGDLNFAASGAFDHLVTGLGIIDITNLYLQIALNYGLIGLALFFLVFLYPVLTAVPALFRAHGTRHERDSGRRVAASYARADTNAPDDPLADEFEVWRRATAVTVSIVVGWLFLVVTTSSVGLTVHLGIVFAALSRALLAQRPQAARESSPAVPRAYRPGRTAVAT